jgi:hypothetical protein
MSDNFRSIGRGRRRMWRRDLRKEERRRGGTIIQIILRLSFPMIMTMMTMMTMMIITEMIKCRLYSEEPRCRRRIKE